MHHGFAYRTEGLCVDSVHVVVMGVVEAAVPVQAHGVDAGVEFHNGGRGDAGDGVHKAVVVDGRPRGRRREELFEKGAKREEEQ